MPNAHGRSLSAHLRSLRKGRSLTLQEVAEFSREAAADPDGFISNPYLAQIESGKRSGISFSKLYTLGRVYGVSINDLVAMASPRAKEKLVLEMARFKAEGKMVPWPVPVALQERPALNRIHSLLTPLAAAVSIPLPWQDVARAVIEKTIVRFTLVPLAATTVESAHAEFFLRGHRVGESRQIAKLAEEHGWWPVVADFFGRFLAARLPSDQLVMPVKSWSMDFHAETADCHFTDPQCERIFGYSSVPWKVVWAVGQSRIAQSLLAVRSDLPPAPSPKLAGSKAYLKWLADSDAAGLTTLASAACDLAKGANGSDAPPEPIHRGVLEFVNRAS